MPDVQTSAVPCNGCKRCCVNDMIFLHPECGDDASIYETENAINPITGAVGLMLAHKPNGECVYLGSTGCKNYDNRPAICREFDCRKFFLRFTKDERRHLLKKGMITTDKLEAGKKRLSTLTAEELVQCHAQRQERLAQ